MVCFYYKGEGRMKRTDEEVRKRAKEILERNQQSSRNMFENEEEKWDFVKRCEKVYRKSSETFVKEFENRGYEGNVDERKWYRLYRGLTEK